MQRTLCMVCLAFLIPVFMLLSIFPITMYEDKVQDGTMLEVVGQVYSKEYKNDTLVIGIRSEGEQVLCYLADEHIPNMGSHVVVKGTYKAFSISSNPGQFHQKKYYQILNLDYSLKNAYITKESEEYSYLSEKINKIRLVWARSYEMCMDEKNAGVLKAMILGDKSDLDGDLKELYKQAGISHILAISGLHISIIGMGMFKLLKKVGIPMLPCIAASMLIMSFYGAMIDGGTSSIRAMIMFALYLGSKAVKRTYDMLTALSVAAVIIVMQQPLYLFHTGFLLSFGAVLGIALCTPMFESIIPEEYRTNPIIKNLIASFSVSFFSLPITAWYFYEVPVYAILLNLVIIPLMTIILIFGIFGGLIGMIILPLGYIILLPCGWILKLYELLCRMLEAFPASTLVVGRPSLISVVIFYAILAPFIIYRKKIKRIVIITGAILAVCILFIRLPKELEITMLDVGQGECIYIREKNGVSILIDGGSTDVSEVGKYRILPFLKYRGERQIDYVFLSHPDADHYNGILECLETSSGSGISIKNLVVTKLAPLPEDAEEGSAYEKLFTAAKKTGCKIIYITKGDMIKCNNMIFTCLYPFEGVNTADTNEGSMVLSLNYNEFNMLFTGDLGKAEMELDMLTKIDILKVGHHGSNYSSSKEFLEKTNPSTAIISCGRNNRYGHPGDDTIERLEAINAKVYITTGEGAISIYPTKNGYVIDNFLKQK